jgi:hypothetical protein
MLFGLAAFSFTSLLLSVPLTYSLYVMLSFFASPLFYVAFDMAKT